MTFRPLHDRILVRRIEADEKTDSGITIPDTAKEKPQEGEVVAAGPDARNETSQLKPPDHKLSDRRKAMLEDIAILTGGTAISDGITPEMLGRARKVSIEKENATIFDDVGRKEEIEAAHAGQGADRGGHLRLRPRGATESAGRARRRCRGDPRRRRDQGRGVGKQGPRQRRATPTRAAVERHPAWRRSGPCALEAVAVDNADQRYGADIVRRAIDAPAPDRGEQQGKRLHHRRQAAREG
ncbi:hypothetical protein MesoLj131a_63250 [Mesorhizobium sp. 131-2-1]|nr:hypothetical protein MesoLj131a_63250 [Mesorhizobium sp. 131-2-1]BCH04529.1 hypothetical protein MesoLj131b_65280 [Mesorhizobium sp. 131-2-5]